MSDRSAGDAGSERDVVVDDSSIAVQRPRYFSTFELLLLGLFSALVVAGNVALRFPIKMPGHSGIVWMALLVTARAVVPRPGAAAIVGLLSGLMAAFLGVGDKGVLDTLLSYAAAGIGVDAVVAVAGRPAGALSCAVAGAAGTSPSSASRCCWNYG